MFFYSHDTVRGIFACDFTVVLLVTKTHDMMLLEIWHAKGFVHKASRE